LNDDYIDKPKIATVDIIEEDIIEEDDEYQKLLNDE
jgi:hypothetical protein